MSELFKTVINVTDEVLSVRFPHEIPKDPSNPTGERTQALSMLFIVLDKQLPFQAVALHAQNPQILPDLLQTLVEFEATTELSTEQKVVLQYVVTLLRELAAQKLVLKLGPERKIDVE